MSDFLTLVNMLSNAQNVDFIVHDGYEGGKAIEFIREDEWYNMIFFFNSDGKLVSVE